VIYGVGGFIGGIIAAAIYNLVAKRTRDLEKGVPAIVEFGAR